MKSYAVSQATAEFKGSLRFVAMGLSSSALSIIAIALVGSIVSSCLVAYCSMQTAAKGL